MKPLSSCFELHLALFKLSSHSFSDFTLQVGINLRYEKLVEMRAAHRTSHASLSKLFLAIEAHHVLAGCEHWLRAKLKADWALIIITLRALNSASRETAAGLAILASLAVGSCCCLACCVADRCHALLRVGSSFYHFKEF